MKYNLQRSEEHPMSWVCADTENLLVVRWQHGKFNDTQEFTPIDDDALLKLGATGIARVAREMADWLRDNHPDKIF